MDGESTGEGKAGEPGKGGAVIELAESSGDPGYDSAKVMLDDAPKVTTPIVLATGHTVTSSRQGSGGVPSSLADDVLMTRYKAWTRLHELKYRLGPTGDDESEVLGVTEVAVVTMDGLRALLRVTGFDKAIGLGLTEDSK